MNQSIIPSYTSFTMLGQHPISQQINQQRMKLGRHVTRKRLMELVTQDGARLAYRPTLHPSSAFMDTRAIHSIEFLDDFGDVVITSDDEGCLRIIRIRAGKEEVLVQNVASDVALLDLFSDNHERGARSRIQLQRCADDLCVFGVANGVSRLLDVQAGVVLEQINPPRRRYRRIVPFSSNQKGYAEYGIGLGWDYHTDLSLKFREIEDWKTIPCASFRSWLCGGGDNETSLVVEQIAATSPKWAFRQTSSNRIETLHIDQDMDSFWIKNFNESSCKKSVSGDTIICVDDKFNFYNEFLSCAVFTGDNSIMTSHILQESSQKTSNCSNVLKSWDTRMLSSKRGHVASFPMNPSSVLQRCSTYDYMSGGDFLVSDTSSQNISNINEEADHDSIPYAISDINFSSEDASIYLSLVNTHDRKTCTSLLLDLTKNEVKWSAKYFNASKEGLIYSSITRKHDFIASVTTLKEGDEGNVSSQLLLYDTSKTNTNIRNARKNRRGFKRKLDVDNNNAQRSYKYDSPCVNLRADVTDSYGLPSDITCLTLNRVWGSCFVCG